jgi:hypothetical protein
MKFPAGDALDEVGMQRVSLLFRKLIVHVGGEPIVDFVVNCRHIVTQVKRKRV